MKYELTKTQFKESMWEGLLKMGPDAPLPPELTVMWKDTALADVQVNKGRSQRNYTVQIPIPPEAVGDGVHVFTIYVAGHDDPLDSFTLIAGEAVGDDLRAEIELLRAELDMLKRAFRRHCSET